MAFSVRQSRTLKAYCCLRGLENEVTSAFCLAPLLLNYFLGNFSVLELHLDEPFPNGAQSRSK